MDDHEWHQVHHRKNKKRKIDGDAPKDLGKPKDAEFIFSPSTRLQNFLKISDLQNLILYLLADGIAPNWIGVRNRQDIQKAVVLMVPGLEYGMFNGSIKLQLDPEQTQDDEPSSLDQNSNLNRGTERGTSNRNNGYTSPDDYYPSKLESMKLHPILKPLSRIFP